MLYAFSRQSNCLVSNRHFSALRLTLAAAALSCLPAAAHAGPGPQGVWLDSTGRGAVEITSCGQGLCGHVVWVKTSKDAKGCGRQIIGDATPSGGKYHGWIYSPEDRKRYNVELSTTNDGRLKVVGYAGVRLFSKTMYWSPADPNLERCGAPQAAPAKQQAATPPPASETTLAGAAGAAASRTPDIGAPKADRKGGDLGAPAAKDVVTDKAPPQLAQPATPALGPSGGRAAASGPAQTVPAPAAGAPSTATATATGDAGKTAQAEAAPPADAAQEDVDEDNGATAASSAGLGRLAAKLDKVIKRTADGDCKLDLPWVKVAFRCERE